MADIENISRETAKEKIFSKIFDPYNPKHLETLFEQYKILVDNGLHLAERFEASNNFFITTNGFVFSVIGFFINHLSLDKNFSVKLLVATLLLVGLSLTLSWMRVIDSYKKTSILNNMIAQVIEEKLPTAVLTFKFFSESEEKTKKRSNPVIHLEASIPRLFIFSYLAVSIIAVFLFINSSRRAAFL